MDDLRRELAGLRLKMRLQSIAMVGTLLILLFATGGAEVVARVLVEADAWKVKTKNAAAVLTDRITVTTDVDTARIKVTNANLELAQQATAPGSPAAGAVWYDSTNAKLKFYNGTAWVESGGTAPPGAAPAGVFGRLAITSSPSTTLRFDQYSGDYVDVNGQYVQIGAGLTLTPGTTVLTDIAGTLSGSMAGNTLYYIYISNASASGAPSSIRGSTLGPVLFNGVKYLNSTGNGANWRFLGYVRTNATPAFVDSPSQRLVINYYNRRLLKLKVVESTSSWTYATATWRAWNNNTNNCVTFISNGEDQVFLHFAEAVANVGGGTTSKVGIALDATNTNHADVFSNHVTGLGGYEYYTTLYGNVTTQGFHTLTLTEMGAASTTFYGTFSGQGQYGAVGWVLG